MLTKQTAVRQVDEEFENGTKRASGSNKSDHFENRPSKEDNQTVDPSTVYDNPKHSQTVGHTAVVELEATMSKQTSEMHPES